MGLAAQTRGAPVTGLSTRVTRAVGDTAFIAAGEFVMGADSRDVARARSLCMRELRDFAAVLGTSASTPLFDMRVRVVARLCGDADLDPPLCHAEQFAHEGEAHPVWLPAYRIDRTEVTVEAWQRCVAAGRCRPSHLPVGTYGFGAPSQPVVGVSWDDAARYCAWVNARLPTEAEWERAARGLDGRPFPWGWQWDTTRANHGALRADCRDDDDGYVYTAPVGSFPQGASPDGLLDMAGNVMEWVADGVIGASPPGRAIDPHVEPSRGLRIARGGAWNHAAFALRTTWRTALPQGARERNLGFRCARDAW